MKFIAAAIIALAATAAPVMAETHPDAVSLFASRVEHLSARHTPHFSGYHYSGLINGKLVRVNGIQVRAWVGRGIFDPCWYLSTIDHTVVTGSCRGN